MTNVDFDPNKIVVDVFTNIVKESTSTIANFLKSPIAKLIDAFRYSMSEYVNSSLKKCANIRTFLNRDEPVSLLEVYVTTTFKSEKKVYSDKQLIENIPHQRTIVILGSAGCGKSMFMRYLFISLCQKPDGRIPLFIELRNLTGITSKNLATFMYHSVVKPGAVATFEQFEKAYQMAFLP